jgi:hypothetical protein
MKVMETIPYRNSKIHIKTIPKGTLMFRMVKKPIDDVRGPLLPDGTRCIIPNWHVFFYPNPFIGKVALGIWTAKLENIYAYILTRDIKVVWLLSPSKYTRNTKNTARTFLKRCIKVPKGCLPRKLDWYNPCFSDTIIKNFPDVVGMMAIAAPDAERAKQGQKRLTRRVCKHFHNATDSAGSSSPPELILHPLKTVSPKDVIVQPDDVLENNFKVIKRFKCRNTNELLKFMETHAVYNPDTFFYTYKE